MTLPFRRQRIARRQMTILELTTADLAERIGCRRSHLANVLSGRSYPSDLIRERMPIVLGLPIQVLLDEALLEGAYVGHNGADLSKLADS